MRALLLLVALGGCQLLFPLRDDDAGVDAAVPKVDTWAAVTAGDSHTCALDVDGKLYCWGRNLDGELGRMGLSELASIREVGDVWRTVASSNRHTCGIKADNTSWCWGANENGQLGTGSVAPSAEPIQTPLAAHAIATANFHTCAIGEADRLIYCWGRNAQSELGEGTGVDSLVPIRATSEQRFASIAANTTEAGPGSSCAIAEDGTLWCWGFELAAFRTIPIPTQFGTDTWKKIALGNRHACGITTAGKLRCWGANFDGQLGNGTTTNSDVPVGAVIDEGERDDWTDVSANGNQSCGIAGGHWFCWGQSGGGQLGKDGIAKNPVPVEINTERPWLAVASGDGHNCAVAADQTMWCLGRRGFSQLGNGSSSLRVPTKLEGTWSSVAAGAINTCAIAPDRSAHCTGDNAFGTLGNGSTNSHRRLLPITTDLSWTVIAPGMFHTCGIRNLEALCWGQDYLGQVNGMPDSAKLTPTRLPSPLAAPTITANGEHTCIPASGGNTAKCWGANNLGQIGIGNTSANEAPRDLGGNFTTIEAGEVHTCAIEASSVKCWGLAVDGRVGNGATTGTQVGAMQVTGLTNPVETLSVGDVSSCAIDATKALHCWGANYGGELGLGDRVPRPVPTQVSGMWSAVSVGTSHTCGLQGPLLFCWGSNDRGQLGLGSFTEAFSPTLVPSEVGWQAVTAGDGFTCALDANSEIWCWGDNNLGQLGTGDAWSTDVVRVIAE